MARWDLLGGFKRFVKAASGIEMRNSIGLFCLLLIFADGCMNPEKERGASRPKPRATKTRRPIKQQALSPVGGYVVTATNPSAKKPERDIVVTRPGEKREILRFPFQRQVDVVWAPNESGVAIIDLVLQNESRVVVFELPSGRLLYELRRENVCELNPELPCGDRYADVFLSNVVWLAPDRIQATLDMANPLEAGLPPRVHATIATALPR
jgi:hypothetical protein